MSFNCQNAQAEYEPHVQGMLLATDQDGLEILLTEDNWLRCPQDMWEAIIVEIEASGAILDAGYSLDALAAGFVEDRADIDRCTHADQTFAGGYHENSIHPLETMFLKTKRVTMPHLMQKYTDWASLDGYYAKEHC